MTGHRVIEQYQAQIWPAIKAAFEGDQDATNESSTSAYGTGDDQSRSPLLWEVACQALVAYVSHGLAVDEVAIRRSVGLLISWLDKNAYLTSVPSSRSQFPPTAFLLPSLAALAQL